MIISLMFSLWGLVGIDYACADGNEKAASEFFLKKLEDSRESRLNKIQANLFAEKINVSHLSNEIKELIKTYRNHLQKFDTAKKIPGLEKNLLQEIGLLLGHLEKGSENIIGDQGQASHCLELISAIESIFEKLEKPETDFSDSELPRQSISIETAYKRLKGEQIPYYLTTSNVKKKMQEERNDLPPLSLAQLKVSALTPESSGDKSRSNTPCYD